MTTVKQNTLGKLMSFLAELEQAHISYRLEHIRDSVTVAIAVPGERWEVEFFDDAHVEVERFRSDGEIEGEDALAVLFATHGDE